jgi:carboxyl-terminal processing protease
MFPPPAPEPVAAPERVAAAPAPDAPPSAPNTTGPAAANGSRTARPVRRLGGRFAIVASAIVAVLAGSGLFLAGFALGSQATNEPGTPADAAQAFKPFWDTYTAITQHYAGDPVTRKQLVDGAIKGMLDSLGDPFSFYLSPTDFTSSLQGLSGQFEGIGATIQSEKKDGTQGCTPLGPNCALIVIEPLAGAPAEKAGLKAADRITKIDGTSVDGSTLDATLAKVRGPKGTVVDLTVVRGTAAAMDIKIVRDVIVQPEIVAKQLAGGRVGYIQVIGFSDNSARQFAAALSADVKAGNKAIVLDLRGNPGGYVTAARAIASQFIASGPIFWERPAAGDPLPTSAEPGGVATDPSIKLAVLIDKGSASASEIVAGALQDTKRGTLVGQQSYGKGTVQQFLPLDNDNGGFRLTIARWLTPNLRWINKVGLTPDVVVPLPASGAAAGTDPTLDRALEVLGIGTSALGPGRLGDVAA